MPIYTKTGDKGETGLFGGKRVPKSDPIINACGTIDELESFIGLIIGKIENKEDIELLTSIQQKLYIIMALLTGARNTQDLTDKDIEGLENRIDLIQERVPKLTRFLLPQGTEVSTWFHVVRAISRRAERAVISISKSKVENQIEGVVLRYLNRLSDLFFMLARQYNEIEEIST
ncbi:ATP:cob(I)alamin adenosyltransferase [Candidatus Roizmanbacteria bacterium RIFCSPLOWO2_02_FULL_39_8]|uniref:Corrinoid adenosyltransferase n=1 Tax=Candidatus Roizmanbacteria bacterium RIFCSPHIGHO2_01_FULL_39_24 TaxID=1802032 RepID=A0A1F7GHN8_9BACT|nr:MAG: ATP:cob(I)alamin adenosyltransferase [Candidatus Roizmanbacteria bacterium RIFCSPHIGHO2_01_FULL_39_24]OGK49727.1 MAG: ATP:cob(I)alamin adenosyltransferase [Candidatus Roizmanbacteria bacterium RIFCSPLOWO2_01_FULL_40_32]OGK56567.1 MAG: ATP:cob(I)alamin adenosyltransferase [Candidatus Roizmanbacteria bacterium RIFCSPLOWO2_02_FULL_39_8]